MLYAIVTDGAVANVIVGPLPDGMDGVPVGELPVGIGDAWDGAAFWRDGARLMTPLEEAQEIINDLQNTLEEVLSMMEAIV